MAQRLGGVDPLEIEEAMDALSTAHSVSDLERALNDFPIISLPIFHAIMRQEYYRMRKEEDPHLRGFEALYQDLFRILHTRAHQRLCQSVSRNIKNLSDITTLSFAPPFFRELIMALDGRLPMDGQPPLNPATDMKQILSEVTTLVGQQVILPSYEPSRGSLWSAVIVVCAGCKQRWLTIRAFMVDLLQAPELIKPLQQGRLNNSVCPHCGEAVCYPIRRWIQEPPGTRDALAALTCAWRLTDSLFVYQPPPGTKRIEDNDRILEIRFATLMDSLTWPEISPPQSKSGTNMAVAYTIKELLSYLNQATGADAEIPMELTFMIHELSRKVRSGLLPLHQAVSHIEHTVPRRGIDWPVLPPGYLRQYDDDLHEYLIQALIAEAVAQAQSLPHEERLLLAGMTSSGFQALGETSLAEAALARAEDLFKAIPADNPNRDYCHLVIMDTRKAIYGDLNQLPEIEQELEQMLEQMESLGLHSEDDLLSRLVLQYTISSQALSHYDRKRFAEALEAFPQCVANLQEMIKEANSRQDARRFLGEIQHTLSGDLANWAAVLMDLSKYVQVWNIMESNIPEEQALQLLQEIRVDPHDAIQYLNDALPILDQMFPNGISSRSLLDRARQLLEQALELAEAVEGWGFAGIQAHRLSGLLYELNLPLESEEMARLAIRYSARVGDHTRISLAEAFLASRALERGDGSAALAHLRVCAREEIRKEIGLGHHAQPGYAVFPLANAAFQATTVGGDSIEAVMIAESLKSATTAASLTHGMPIQPAEKVVEVSAHHLRELMQQRESLRSRTMWNPEDGTLIEELKELQIKIDDERKALSLRDHRFARWVDATDIDVSNKESLIRRLNQLGSKATFMGVFPIGNKVWTYMVWSDGCIISQQLLPDRRQERFAAESSSPFSKWWDENYLTQLAIAILEPLDERLKELDSNDRLVISTFDGLYNVPFSALPYRGRPLSEHVCISLVQGIGVFEACFTRASGHINSLLAVGSPQRPDMDALPGALREVQQLIDTFNAFGKQTCLLTGKKATVPALESCVSQYHVVHFACHANSSRLMLAPDVLIKDSGELTEDRILSEIRLLPGSIINLSGCATGIQTERNIPLLGGLIPAFLVAGAGSVIGSLWPIEDSLAVRFQAEFYKLLLAGQLPTESLANTQRACIAGTFGAEMQAPEVWAGYVVYGAG